MDNNSNKEWLPISELPSIEEANNKYKDSPGVIVRFMPGTVADNILQYQLGTLHWFILHPEGYSEWKFVEDDPANRT